MPKFIVIEGSNGSGKQTQATMLTQYFKNIIDFFCGLSFHSVEIVLQCRNT